MHPDHTKAVPLRDKSLRPHREIAMNKIHSKIWNPAPGAMVVASELAHSRRRAGATRLRLLVGALALALAPLTVQAQTAPATCTITTDGVTTTVPATPAGDG